MDVAGSRRKLREVEFGLTCRVHDCAITVANADGLISDTFVNNVG